MGFRYRKSIRLGGGFRINISGSGVGYSWGVPGYRITKTANGKIRQTASIPGTGISYSTEESIHKSAPNSGPEEDSNIETEIIQSEDRGNYKDADFKELMRQIKSIRWLNRLLFIFAVLSFIFLPEPTRRLYAIGFLILLAVVHRFVNVKLFYDFTDEQATAYTDWYDAWCNLFSCNTVWYINKLEKGHNEKTNAGTSKSAVPKKLLKAPKLPYYIKTNAPYFSAALSKEESFYILPDKVFYVHNGKLSAYDSDEIEYDAQLVHPVIDKAVMKIPKDTKVVDTTWLKVNADGSRDKRYKSNRQCYICECGQLRIYSPSGLNLYLMFSNPESVDDFNSVIAK